MGRLKKYERFLKSLNKLESKQFIGGGCERCGLKTNSTTMSIFNTETICMDCKKCEREDPEYDAASRAESKEVQRGNYNYEGVIIDYKPLPE